MKSASFIPGMDSFGHNALEEGKGSYLKGLPMFELESPPPPFSPSDLHEAFSELPKASTVLMSRDLPFSGPACCKRKIPPTAFSLPPLPELPDDMQICSAEGNKGLPEQQRRLRQRPIFTPTKVKTAPQVPISLMKEKDDCTSNHQHLKKIKPSESHSISTPDHQNNALFVPVPVPRRSLKPRVGAALLQNQSPLDSDDAAEDEDLESKLLWSNLPEIVLIPDVSIMEDDDAKEHDRLVELVTDDQGKPMTRARRTLLPRSPHSLCIV